MARRRHSGSSRLEMDRRVFLASATALACWPVLSWRPGYAADRAFRFQKYPFSLGVASGDPRADSVVLWTRLAPEPLDGGGMPNEDVTVCWEVAQDESFSRIVQRGEQSASPDWAHAVHTEVTGLEPDRVYFYRFRAGGEVSPVGRTRTAPAADALLDRFRFTFASCQHFETGYYTAYEHMLRDDPNLVVHLGDYIYEGAAISGRVRQHLGGECQTLEDYRTRYSLYKTDAHLQAMHAVCPWVVTWDDHEFVNNCAGELPAKPDVDPVEYLKRRAAAYKAYFEHMPLRPSQLPSGPHLTLYRTVDFGSLLRFSVLDARQYRTHQPCGDRNKPMCDGVFDPHATMLGAMQEEWLNKNLLSSSARWNVLAQQVMMGRVDRDPTSGSAYSMDQWAGYEYPRRRMLETLSSERISNPVVLTGDIHTNWVNDLKIDFDAPDSPAVATEFVGTSISSGGDGAETRKDTAGVLADNPFVKFYNAERGYVRCDVTAKSWQTDFRVVEYVSRVGGDCQTRASFVVEEGRPGAQRV